MCCPTPLNLRPKAARSACARVLSDLKIEISVTDTGIGIARADLETVMAPFGQVESILTRKFDGTGLGLSLTRSLVEIQGGEFVIQSKQGLGTKVVIKLPLNS
jgi:signal transduction histidine kinase